MPAYKDEQRGTWYCLFYYEDWQDNKKKKQKRGFKTKREALDWENNYKMSANANMVLFFKLFTASCCTLFTTISKIIPNATSHYSSPIMHIKYCYPKTKHII